MKFVKACNACSSATSLRKSLRFVSHLFLGGSVLGLVGEPLRDHGCVWLSELPTARPPVSALTRQLAASQDQGIAFMSVPLFGELHMDDLVALWALLWSWFPIKTSQEAKEYPWATYPDPWADPKSRSTLGLYNLNHRSTRAQNWGGSTFWILPGVWVD